MKYPTRIFFGVILTSLFSFGMSASAQVTSPATLECSLKTEKGSSFSITAGTETIIDCTVKNTKQDEGYSAMLLGKQTAEDGVSTSAVTSLAVGKDAVSAVLVFPAVFQPGTYQYTFSLIDTKTKEALAKEVTLTGILKGAAQASIKQIGTDKAAYQWGESFQLKVALDVPRGTALDSLSLSAVLTDTEKKECSVLMGKQAITKEEGIFHLVFTKEQKCTNTLVVTLRSGDTVLDEESLAVGLPQVGPVTEEVPARGSMTGIPLYLLGGMVLTAVLVVALFGYALIKRRVKKY